MKSNLKQKKTKLNFFMHEFINLKKHCLETINDGLNVYYITWTSEFYPNYVEKISNLFYNYGKNIDDKTIVNMINKNNIIYKQSKNKNLKIKRYLFSNKINEIFVLKSFQGYIYNHNFNRCRIEKILKISPNSIPLKEADEDYNKTNNFINKNKNNFYYIYEHTSIILKINLQKNSNLTCVDLLNGCYDGSVDYLRYGK